MIFHRQKLPGVFTIDAEPFLDDRGAFRRGFCRREFAARGIVADVAQINISENRYRHTLRGFHYQAPPHGEGKTMTCLQGAIYDVILDLRAASPTYASWIAVELTPANRRSIHVPPGCANAFLTLADDTLVVYYASAFYRADAERGVRYDDPAFRVTWPAAPAVISDKDRGHPDFDLAHSPYGADWPV